MNTDKNCLIEDTELEGVTGGAAAPTEEAGDIELNTYCPHCQSSGKNVTQHLHKKNGRVYCPACDSEYPELA